MDFFRHKHWVYLAKGMKKLTIPQVYNVIGNYEVKWKGNKILKKERTGINPTITEGRIEIA